MCETQQRLSQGTFSQEKRALTILPQISCTILVSTTQTVRRENRLGNSADLFLIKQYFSSCK